MKQTKERRGLRVANRYLEVVQNSELLIADRIKVIESELKNMNFYPLSEAAKLYGITYNGMKKRIKENREMYISVGDSIFVSVS